MRVTPSGRFQHCGDQERNVDGPDGAVRSLVCVEVAEEQRGLEEDQAGDPDGGRSPEHGKQLPRGHGLDKKQ